MSESRVAGLEQELERAKRELSDLLQASELREAHARFNSVADFTALEAAYLFTGRDPVFWGAPSAKALRDGTHKWLGRTVALYKELLKQLDGRQLRATSSVFNADGTHDGENTRISRADLDAFRERCGILTAPLPGMPAEAEKAHVDARSQQAKRDDAIQHTRGIKRAILEHWSEITRRFGPEPDGAQVSRMLAERRDKSERKPCRKTVQNRLCELRNEGLIP